MNLRLKDAGMTPRELLNLALEKFGYPPAGPTDTVDYTLHGERIPMMLDSRHRVEVRWKEGGNTMLSLGYFTTEPGSAIYWIHFCRDGIWLEINSQQQEVTIDSATALLEGEQAPRLNVFPTPFVRGLERILAEISGREKARLTAKTAA